MSGRGPGGGHAAPADAAWSAADFGRRVEGPPWILGWRGSPREAPEHTRAGLARALELGLDGLACELRTCASGELVLHADATLERTTDGRGLLAERSWRELAELDAGSSFGARFRGTPLALLEEALALPGPAERGAPQFVLLCPERIALGRLRALVDEHARHSSIRLGSRDREFLLEARDAGFEGLLLADALDEETRAWVGRTRTGAVAARAAAWRATRASWDCERWLAAADAPDELAWAAEQRFHGLWTREPLRALAQRALRQLAPAHAVAPLIAPRLALEPLDAPGVRGAWWGSWSAELALANPCPFAVRAAAGVLPRRGAFEVTDLPQAFELEPGETRRVPFRLVGGAWSPGGDPLAWLSLRWRAGPGRPAGRLLLDAPLERVRRLELGSHALRVPLLREAPGAAPATMLVRRHRGSLLVSVERGAAIAGLRTHVLLEGQLHHGARGVRVRLPRDFDQRAEGLEFCCGFEGRLDGRPVLRRWSGGWPVEGDPGAGDPGAPGRLVADARA